MNTFTIYLIGVGIGCVFTLSIFYITDRLNDVPKSNKFRQWWSKHIVDMDGKYEE